MQVINLFLVNIYTGDMIATLCKAGSCYQANIACSNDDDFHYFILLIILIC